MPLDKFDASGIIKEINQEEEKSRRAYAERRHKIYRDGGREYLLEYLQTEFGRDAIKEMRLAPINFLKKIVNKKSQVYKQPPIRTTENPADQPLVDYWVEDLGLDDMMQKANRYYNLHANTALYAFPMRDTISLAIVPPHLYSIVPDPMTKKDVLVWVFSEFKENMSTTPYDDKPSATGASGFMRTRWDSGSGDLVDSMERPLSLDRKYIFWTPEAHFTTDGKGGVLTLDPSKGEEQFMNPLGINPVVHLQKDTDAEAWAEQGEDAADLSLALQLGWSDLLTIAKHQGFAQMVITSEEEPQAMNIGINKVLWLKKFEGQEAPKLEYLSANSPLGEYKELLQELLALLLTTNDISPSAIGRQAATQFTSGFHALIEQSDALEAMRADQPVLRDAEKDLWEVLKGWHNFMFDAGILRDDAKALGKFSDDFSVSISYGNVKPLESEAERLGIVERLKGMSLITRLDALKKLNPDLKDDQAEAKLTEIDDESASRMAQFGLSKPKEESEDKEGSEEDEDERPEQM